MNLNHTNNFNRTSFGKSMLNRTFAYAKVYGPDKAVAEAEKLDTSDSSYYHQLLGYLYKDISIHKSISHYSKP